MEEKIDKILGLLDPNKEAMETGKQRQEAIWKGDEPDFLPILIGGIKNLYTEAGKCKVGYDWELKFAHGGLVGGVEVPEFDLFPHYDLKEQFYHKEKMLAEYTWELIARARCKSDAQLSIRSNHGCAIVPSIFGAKYLVFPDKPPWFKEHLSIDQIIHQDLNSIEEKGLYSRISEFMRYFKRKLQGKAQVYLPVVLGPFDTAHLLRGTDIFLDAYDHPSSVFKLMEKTTEIFIKSNILWKKVIDESLTAGMYDSVYMVDCGVRITEDSSVLLSPEMWSKFVKPFIKEALKPFGGGVTHFCGKADYLLETHLSLPEVKGVNLGQPELYEYESTINKFIAAGKVFIGSCWPRRKDESAKDYFSRILSPLKGKKRSLIFQPAGEGEWPEPRKTIDLWHSLQDG